MLTATNPQPSFPPQLAAAPSSAPSDRTRFEPPTDTELMTLAAEGRDQALSELYGRYARMLLALALRMLRNRSDAEDVLQEVFLYVWKQACAYDAARSSVATWLVLITRSRSLDRIKMHQRLSDKVSDGDFDQTIEIERPVAENTDDGFDRVLGGERRARLFAELQRLPEPQRQVLELFYFQGMTQKEVAELMDVPVGTVKTRTLLGVKKLRRALGREVLQLA